MNDEQRKDLEQIAREELARRDRERHILRGEVTPNRAATWLLNNGLAYDDAAPYGDRFRMTKGQRVECLIPARQPYQMGLAQDGGLWAVTIEERDYMLVFESAPADEGRSAVVWRPGVTTREEPDMTIPVVESYRHSTDLMLRISGWIREARRHVAADAMDRARQAQGWEP